MATRGFLAERSGVEWTIRLLVAVAILWIGYQAVRISRAISLPASQIERAYALAPDNARIAGQLTETLLDADATANDRARADRIARTALRRDPTVVEAAATLGALAFWRKDTAGARSWFGYAERLSRRDLRTQIWGIQDAAAHNDLPAVLRHYDIALRTNRGATELLFPALAAAISYPGTRLALVKTLAEQPLWTDAFVNYVATSGPDPQATAALFRGLLRKGVSVSDRASARVIGALIDTGKYDEAWSYYAAVRKGAERRRSQDPDFTANLEVPSALDWVPQEGTGISATLQRSGDGGVFEFAAAPAVGGPVLRQLLMLPPGKYVLSGHSTGIEQPETSLPYWLLSCRNGGDFGQFDIPNSASENGRFEGHFTVPSGCPVQALMLVARSSSEIAGSFGRIDHALLRPAS